MSACAGEGAASRRGPRPAAGAVAILERGVASAIPASTTEATTATTPATSIAFDGIDSRIFLIGYSFSGRNRLVGLDSCSSRSSLSASRSARMSHPMIDTLLLLVPWIHVGFQLLVSHLDLLRIGQTSTSNV
jgi:hypothetical protein